MAKKKAFTIWTVAGKEYNLKLKSSGICEAEEKLGGTNILMFIGAENGFPTLNAMIIIVYCAMKPWNHGPAFCLAGDICAFVCFTLA